MDTINRIIAIIGAQVSDHKDDLEPLEREYGKESVAIAIGIRNEIRRKVEDKLWREKRAFTDVELKTLVMNVIDSDYPQYDRASLASVTGYMAWYAWHEGFIK